MEVAGEGGLDDVEVGVGEVEEGCCFGGVGPFVEVGEVGVGLELRHIDRFLVDGVGSVDKTGDFLLLKKLDQSLDGADVPRHRYNMVKHRQFYLLGVAVHKIFHRQLEGLRRLHIFCREIYLFLDTGTSWMVMLKCYRSQLKVFRTQA